jgi:hypothetical protein
VAPISAASSSSTLVNAAANANATAAAAAVTSAKAAAAADAAAAAEEVRMAVFICRVGQNHTFIGIYGVHTVFLARKSPRSNTVQIYGSDQPYLLFICMCRAGQNHIYTVYIQYFWLGNHQIYGVYIRFWPTLFVCMCYMVMLSCRH